MAGSSKGSLFDGQYRAVTPEVEKVVAVVQATFLAARSAYLPHAPMRASKRDKDHFLQAAFLIRKLGVDPAEFTQRQVDAMAITGSIFASGVASKKVADRQPSKDVIRSESLAHYQAQYLLFKQLIPHYTAYQILMDPVHQFSPLFRACVALRLGLPTVVLKYREPAMCELTVNPVIRELFPEVSQL